MKNEKINELIKLLELRRDYREIKHPKLSGLKLDTGSWDKLFCDELIDLAYEVVASVLKKDKKDGE